MSQTTLPYADEFNYELDAAGYTIKIELGDNKTSGNVSSNIFHDSEKHEKPLDDAAKDLLESFVLALAIEGIDMRDGRVERALLVAIEGYVNAS